MRTRLPTWVHRLGGGGALTYKSDVRVPPSTSDVGLSVTNCVKADKNRGSFSEMHQKIGAFGAKKANKLSTFHQIYRNVQKIQIFAENCHLFDY